MVQFVESLLLGEAQQDLAVLHIGYIIDVGDQAAPDCAAVLGRHPKGQETIKLRREEIGIVVPAEEFLEAVFLGSVEYELFFPDVPVDLVVLEDAQTHSKV